MKIKLYIDYIGSISKPFQAKALANLLYVFAGIFLLAGCDRGREFSQFYIFEDGQPMTSIVLSETAQNAPFKIGHMRHLQIPEGSPNEVLHAVELFRKDIREGFGVEIPLGENADLPNRIEIDLIETTVDKEDETEISFPSENVMRIRGGQSGIIRTLFYLLEEFAGVRYLFQGGMEGERWGFHYPDVKTLSIPAERMVKSSAFPLDRSSSQTTYGSHWEGDRNRLYWWSWEALVGSKARVPMGHTMGELAFPLEEYAKAQTKPDKEIFPIQHGKRVLPWEGGVRADSHWQPRFSSQATVDEAVKNILAYLEKHPETTGISLTVNDGGGHCETEQGREVETYYHWVNAVAQKVTEKHPHVLFGASAYREVSEPPNFPVHPNVVTYLTFDLHSTMDPAVRANREKFIQDWSKAGRFGIYSYNAGDANFTLPRIYFQEVQQMLKFAREHGAEAAHAERGYNLAAEGPKMYLYQKLLENPDLDLESAILDWCQAAVGEEAAPYLRKYYAFWEDFWRTKAIETSWWQSSKNNIYLSLPPFGTYMLAIEAGDMDKCREYMDKVVELAEAAGSEAQKKRAAFLMSIFEWYEANATASGGEFFHTDGTLPDSATALAFLKHIPKAVAAYKKSLTLPHETKGWIAPNITTSRLAAADVVVGSLASISDYLDDPAVVEELTRLAANPDVSSQIRFLAEIMVKSSTGDASGNMVGDGSMATENHGWAVQSPTHGKVERRDEVAARGSHSLKCFINHTNFTAELNLPDAKAGTDYYVSAKVFIPEDQAVAEGRLNIWGQGTYLVGDKLHNRGRTRNIPDIMLNPGQWNYVSAIIPGDQLTQSLRVGLQLKSFEKGDVAFIDDVQVFEIPSTLEAELP